MPDVTVIHVGVGEHAGLNRVFLDQLREVVLGENGNPVGILRTRQGGRVLAGLDSRDLGGGESHDLGGRIVAVDHIEDRKSTRLNSSHGYISYAVFCLKKKKIHLYC